MSPLSHTDAGDRDGGDILLSEEFADICGLMSLEMRPEANSALLGLLIPVFIWHVP